MAEEPPGEVILRTLPAHRYSDDLMFRSLAMPDPERAGLISWPFPAASFLRVRDKRGCREGSINADRWAIGQPVTPYQARQSRS